ncbi:MAG: chloride channel protein, partial [Pirellulaceae bacterium]|nr:chloride channel protein [Pirellulaceae bacterium]
MPEGTPLTAKPWRRRLRAAVDQRPLRTSSKTLALSAAIGVLAGLGAVAFTNLILYFERATLLPAVELSQWRPVAIALVCACPAAGLLAVAWLTRRFAPEAQGHGVPEVITAVARKDGVIRPRVALVKILASGLCIGTGGSIGREGPIVQIGATLGSLFGQRGGLPAREIKILVAAGAAAGISATFNAPIAGVIFASEIILGSFAVEALTPIVIASVLAAIVQMRIGEHGQHSAFIQLNYSFQGAWEQLPSFLALGLICGCAAAAFTRGVYAIEDVSKRWLVDWRSRAIVLGLLVGLVGVCYPLHPPTLSEAAAQQAATRPTAPALFGVGYRVVDHALHLDNDQPAAGHSADADNESLSRAVSLRRDQMRSELLWLLPLVLLKPLLTSLTLAGGGSGGVFAPSLFLGATLGATFGLAANLVFPEASAPPGVYAIVGMGAVVAGTTQGLLGAVIIVFEMTSDYRIILPIMATAGLASLVARLITPESIYHLKLSRRGESIARSHETSRLEHVMVRDVMMEEFPSVSYNDNVRHIIHIARQHSDVVCLPVMDAKGQLLGLIRTEELHRIIDSRDM